MLARGLEIVFHHFRNQLLQGDFWLPSEPLLRVAGIAQERIHFGRPEITLVHLDNHIADA